MHTSKSQSDEWFWQMVREQLKRQKAYQMAMHVHMVGKKYGRWEVIGYWGMDGGPNMKMLCVCECGNLGTITVGNLRHALSKSCGCLRHDLLKRGCEIGQRYFHLELIDRCLIREDNKWVCVCDCGALLLVKTCNLINSVTQSCGCSRRDRSFDKVKVPKEIPLDPHAFLFPAPKPGQQAGRRRA